MPESPSAAPSVIGWFGLAMGVTGGIFRGLLAERARAEVYVQCPMRTCADLQRRHAAMESREEYENLAYSGIGLMVAGGVGLGVAAIWHLVRDESTPTTLRVVSWSPGPGGFLVRF